jgi:hypothetical protein
VGRKYLILAVIAIMEFCSCQKVINVNLNNAASKFVITGNVSNEPGPYIVSISKTINFSEDNVFPSVTNALVVITDSIAAVTDTLSRGAAGYYQTHVLQGIPGHVYQLYVNIGGQVFLSRSVMPQPIALDSIYVVSATFGDKKDVTAVYNDPVGVGNHYHLTLSIADSSSTNIYIHSDQVTDGNRVLQQLRNSIDIHSGDSVKVALECIDDSVYKYYSTLSQTINQNSATPANPQTNISGGSLGYFSAHTVSRKGIIAD